MLEFCDACYENNWLISYVNVFLGGQGLPDTLDDNIGVGLFPDHLLNVGLKIYVEVRHSLQKSNDERGKQ